VTQNKNPRSFCNFYNCHLISVGDVGSHFPDLYVSSDIIPTTVRKYWLNLENSVIGVSDNV